MPLFLSDDDLRLLRSDPDAFAERVDAVIRELRMQNSTLRAESDAASIAAEQQCVLIEQRYTALADDCERTHAESARLAADAERRGAELAEALAEKHQLHLRLISKDGEIERLSTELTELNKARQQSMSLLEMRDAEISEKNATIQSYLDKIVHLTDVAASKDARLQEIEIELTRCRASCNRLTEEKELLEKHNSWLDDELRAKVKTVTEMRQSNMELEAQSSLKISELEHQVNEMSTQLQRCKGRNTELEQRISQLEQELSNCKSAATANEHRLVAELSTMTKLVELHKESSLEWSKKSGSLEGVIKALETHLEQVQAESREKHEKEASIREDLMKEVADLRLKLQNCEAELENVKKNNESSIAPITRLPEISELLGEPGTKALMPADAAEGSRALEGDQMIIVPRVPSGVSGTALANSLIRDGWTLAKMYIKYQEVADALRHERWGRRHAESVLEKILREVEEKAELIFDERAEHARMVEAYTLMNHKLQQALLEQEIFESTIRNLKAEIKMRERDTSFAQKEIEDLQKQVVILLKECEDVQVRCGFTGGNSTNIMDKHSLTGPYTFKDISGLVQQNRELHRQVHRLSAELETRNAELQAASEAELQKVRAEGAAKVEAILKRSEEQKNMVEALHSSVAMYKRLYEEEYKRRKSADVVSNGAPEDTIVVDVESSQDELKKAHEQVMERTRSLEQEVTTLRNELSALRIERDKALMEAGFSKDRCGRLMTELEHQREESNAISARNVELTHLLVSHQRSLRESSEAVESAEENRRKLLMEVTILKRENEILQSAEKRALNEVQSMTERVHRLQSSLDTLQATEEAKEIARATERRNQEEHIRRVEREWAEVKKELQEERDHSRSLVINNEKVVETSSKQVEEMRKELADAWRSVASAESRAATAEAKCNDLLGKLSGKAIVTADGPRDNSAVYDQANDELWKVKEKMENLREESEENKKYMLQYKEIALSNEVALKQIESVHEEYKAESEISKKALEDELSSVRGRLLELENGYAQKSEEAAKIIEAKEDQVSTAMAEISNLRNEVLQKVAYIESLELQFSSLKDDLEKEHKRWRTAHDNYERQVILQSETIKELTNASDQVARLQREVAKLREISEQRQTENDSLRASWEIDKMVLQKDLDDAQKKLFEVNEQNKMLLKRAEDLHKQLSEKDSNLSGKSSYSGELQPDNDMQSVISYLRRSKEIAETEISLLKQEKLRLQFELESAQKACQETQILLRTQTESARTKMLDDEEFKSLQLQVREINLLRESNSQLREENKYNFGECQRLHDEAKQAKLEVVRLENILLEKHLENEACQKELEMQKVENINLNQRLSEAMQKDKHVDPVLHDKMKDELEQLKILYEESRRELEQAKKLVAEKQEQILELEKRIVSLQSDLAVMENRLNDAIKVQADLKSESDLQKRMITSSKKKMEALKKEKEELMKEIQGHKNSGSSVEQAMKEKDFKLQSLERMKLQLEENLRKERTLRAKNRTTVENSVNSVNQEKKRLEEELEKHKQLVADLIENNTVTDSQLPPMSELNQQAATFFRSAQKHEETVSSMLNEGTGSHLSTEGVDTAVISAEQSAGLSTSGHGNLSSAQVEGTEEKPATTTNIVKPTDVRKPVRKLVRPPLDWGKETRADEVPTVGPTIGDVRTGTANEPHASQAVTSSSQHGSQSRKRVASSSQSTEEVSNREVGSNVLPLAKRPKEDQEPQTASEPVLPSSEDLTVVHELISPSDESFEAPAPSEEMDMDQAPAMTAGEIQEMEADIDTAKEGDDHAQEEDKNQDHDNQPAGLLSVDEQLEDARASMDFADQFLNFDEAREQPQQQRTPEVEDDREEGEFSADDVEPQQDDGATGESHLESAPAEDVYACEEPAGAMESGLLEGVSEKSDVDTDEPLETTEKIIEDDYPESRRTMEGAPEGSPSQISQLPVVKITEVLPSAASEATGSKLQGSIQVVPARQEAPILFTPVAETSSSAPIAATSEMAGADPLMANPTPAASPPPAASPVRPSATTITLAERARRNSQLRQAGLLSAQSAQADRQASSQSQPRPPAPPRGRGRAAPTARRGDVGRGMRGRGGRGQT